MEENDFKKEFSVFFCDRIIYSSVVLRISISLFSLIREHQLSNLSPHHSSLDSREHHTHNSHFHSITLTITLHTSFEKTAFVVRRHTLRWTSLVHISFDITLHSIHTSLIHISLYTTLHSIHENISQS